MPPYQIYSIHNHALTIEFSKEISEDANRMVMALKDAIEANPFEGFIECVPAYGSLGMYFSESCRLYVVRKYIDEIINTCLDYSHSIITKPSTNNIQPITIPVCYHPSLGIDLDWVSSYLNLSVEEIVSLHTSISYRVYMIGFIPGFPYMGTLPAALEVPRKQTPSIKIPMGSVAIAGKQTGIYPAEVPGGWQVIGRTPLRMFDKTKEHCSVLNAGDIIQFKSITLEEFNQYS